MIFPPAFLDSSSWNTNQQQHQDHDRSASFNSVVIGGEGNLLQARSATAGMLEEGYGGGNGGSAPAGPPKPMSMSERARLARIPQPEPGLKCPRCDSTNTKFCYFNNYSLSQPRHFCRSCRRYWTRGGALRNVPVGGGYRRHAKRAKPKATTPAAVTAASASASPTFTCTMEASTFPGMLGNTVSMLPPLHRIADFDAVSLSSSIAGAAKPFADTVDAYSVGGGSVAMEQWRSQQLQNFPFLHALDHQMGPAPAMPATMAIPGMFHLGLDGGGGNGEGREDREFHVMPMKREEHPRGVYGDHVSGYASYSSSAGNLL